MVLRRTALTTALLIACRGLARAHGESPGAPEWEQVVADLAVFAVTMALLLGLGWRGLGPLLRADLPGPGGRRVLVAGLAVALLAGLGWLVARGTVGRFLFPPPPDPNYHSHRVERGGQVAMHGNYHVEFTRFRDEYRVWVSDAWRRPIAPQHYRATLALEPGGPALSMEAGPGDYRFVKAPAPDGPGEARLVLEVPGKTLRFNFPVGGG